MSNEATIFKTLGGGHLLKSKWPQLVATKVPGTKFMHLKFSDGSGLYLAEDGELADVEDMLSDFWSNVCRDPQVINWFLMTPTGQWPQPLVKAWGAAAAKDTFCAELWSKASTK